MPDIVRQCNSNMGGVDLHNHLIAHYRSYHRTVIAHNRSYHQTVKWPVRFFEHFKNMACVNIWLTYRNDSKRFGIKKSNIIDLHYFKMQIAELLIIDGDKKYHDDSENDSSNDELPPQKRQAGRPGNVSLPRPEKRIKSILHLPEAMDLTTAQRCQRLGCRGRSRIRCTKCKVYLCVLKERNCFFFIFIKVSH